MKLREANTGQRSGSNSEMSVSSQSRRGNASRRTDMVRGTKYFVQSTRPDVTIGGVSHVLDQGTHKWEIITADREELLRSTEYRRRKLQRWRGSSDSYYCVEIRTSQPACSTLVCVIQCTALAQLCRRAGQSGEENGTFGC